MAENQDPIEEQDEPKQEAKLTDKHGQEAISKAKFERETAKLQEQIEKLTKENEVLRRQGEESAEKDGQIADLKKAFEEYKTEAADKELTSALKLAGCKSIDDAKLLMANYENDVSKLRESLPWMFESKQGSTGAKPAAASSTEDQVKRYRKLAGLTD